MPLLHLLAWIACVIYSTVPAFWLLVHPRVDFWRSLRTSPYKILLPTWIAMWIALAAITFRWRSIPLYQTKWTWLPAAILFATGLTLYKLAGHHFTLSQLGGLPELLSNHHDQKLIITGIRARIRHPVYLAHICEMVAWSLASGLAVCWTLTALAIATGGIMIRMEDEELEKRFGDEYRNYRHNVPALVPKFHS
jgi:protein-S-isoprenylcysteine O-methyltransferase Ste14